MDTLGMLDLPADGDIREDANAIDMVQLVADTPKRGRLIAGHPVAVLHARNMKLSRQIKCKANVNEVAALARVCFTLGGV